MTRSFPFLVLIGMISFLGIMGRDQKQNFFVRLAKKHTAFAPSDCSNSSGVTSALFWTAECISQSSA